jgi:uncharacterized protein (TIGR02757 family)
MITAREKELKAGLESLRGGYGGDSLGTDPLRFAHRFDAPEDREVAALLSALFAYGNVKAMGAFLEGLFARLGGRPSRTLRRGAAVSDLQGYRFQTGSDVGLLLRAVGAVLREHGTLEACFASRGGAPADKLEGFVGDLRARARSRSAGLLHLLPLPSSGSACKRWWLFLRWVCRPGDGVDLGLWNCVRPSELLLPVDTHVARIARSLGLTARKSPDGRFSREATAALARLCPEDPVRYDFALARLGILGICPCGSGEAVSAECPLRALCNHGR